MRSRFLHRASAAAVALTLAIFAGAPAGAQQEPADPEAGPQPKPSAKSRERVFLKDLQGTWIARDYLERLRNSRTPHATARQAPGIAIKIQHQGSTYSILTTNFQKAVLNFVVDIQPDVKPGAYRLALAKEDRQGAGARDLTYLSLRGERDADGVFQTLSISEPNFAQKRYLTYLRLSEPLENFVNRAVLAGQYRDPEGQAYEFTDAGEAILPDRSFQYEVSLDPTRASCELIISHREREPEGKERIGFAWKGAALQLYEVVGRTPPFKCKSTPFAVLTRQ
jgi:hypothetical protein